MNYDIDVPLFLGALYGDRRVHDIALLRAIERQSGGLKFDGQVGEYAYNHSCAQRTAGACIEHGCPTYTLARDVQHESCGLGCGCLHGFVAIAASGERQCCAQQVNFCSGWEWGYWLGDVMTARAAWSTGNGSDATRRLQDALLPIARVFDAAAGGDGCAGGCAPLSVGSNVTEALTAIIEAQRALLINGLLPSITQATGHAYLSGWDTDAELESCAVHMNLTTALTQPDRLPLAGWLARFRAHSVTIAEVRPLLEAMDETFEQLAQQWIATAAVALEPSAALLFDELTAALRVTALRARQVFAVYDASYYAELGTNLTHAKMRLADALASIVDASAIVAHREQAYRVPLARIAGWQGHDSKAAPLVTAYQNAYLWTVHSLLYWWRDYGRVKHKLEDSPFSLLGASPCYLNFNAPADVGVGEGLLQQVASVLESVLGRVPVADLLADCAAPPQKEIHLPADL